MESPRIAPKENAKQMVLCLLGPKPKQVAKGSLSFLVVPQGGRLSLSWTHGVPGLTNPWFTNTGLPRAAATTQAASESTGVERIDRDDRPGSVKLKSFVVVPFYVPRF